MVPQDTIGISYFIKHVISLVNNFSDVVGSDWKSYHSTDDSELYRHEM